MHELPHTASLALSRAVPQSDAHTDTATEGSRLYSREDASTIIERVKKLDPANASSMIIGIIGWWHGELHWARNRVYLAADRRDIRITIIRNVNGSAMVATSNQTDQESLEGALRNSERTNLLANRRPWPSFPMVSPRLPLPKTTVWSDATFDATIETRGAITQTLSDAAEQHGLLAAGYMEVRGGMHAVYNPNSAMQEEIWYRHLTQTQCSMTTRHPKGTGSGWAGRSSYDWGVVDASTIAARALDKCLQSLNPVAVEPGRYTTILEPQAAYQIAFNLAGKNGPLNNRDMAENGLGPFALERDFSLGLWRTKLGLKVVDERLTFSHDPVDPMLGVPTEPGLEPIVWIKDGVLTAMSYPRSEYSLPELNDHIPQAPRAGLRVSGGPTSREEMIATTKRGLLVTRFSELQAADNGMLVGFTRDGLWLIENGKITKTVKNFRILEDPLFVLNQVEQIGPAEPVFAPIRDPYQHELSPVIVPPIKVRDFSFTHMVDAV